MIYRGVIKASSITDRKRTTAGKAMFMANGGEHANKIAHIQANSKDVSVQWHYRINRAAFTWQEPRRKKKDGGKVSFED